MKSAFALFSLFVSALHAATGVSTLKLSAEIKGFSSPESIAWDGAYYYVSNVGKELKPTEKDGDGFISRMDAKGENLKLDFIGKLNAPKGMIVIGKTLYVCDIDVLLGFDLITREKTFEVSFAKDGVTFLNDVCSAGPEKLIVSATDKNQVYLVDLKESSAKPIQFDQAPNGPNGLAFFGVEEINYLLISEWGADGKPNGSIRAYTLDESSLVAEEQEKPKDSPMKAGYLDGLAVSMKDGKARWFLYSDWVAFKPGGKLVQCVIDSSDNTIQLSELEIPNAPVAGPADFFYHSKSSTLVLPCMIEGRVLIFRMEEKNG